MSTLRSFPSQVQLNIDHRPRMTTARLDDRNTAISYTGAGTWNHGGVRQEFDSTTTWFNGTGGIVSLQFNGTSVAVWGTIGNTADGADARTSYTVDGGATVVFAATQDADVHYQQRFFFSGPLNQTSHTLIIETLSPAAAYYLDYIDIGLDPSAEQPKTTTVTVISSAPQAQAASAHASELGINGVPTATQASTTSTGNGIAGTGIPLTTTALSSESATPANRTAPVGAIIGGG